MLAREVGGALGLEAVDGVGLAHRDTDVVESVEEPVLDVGLHRERLVDSGCRHLHRQLLYVDDDLGLWVGLEGGPDRLDGRFRHDDRHEAVLRAVVLEDVGEARRDHGVEAVLLDGPHRVLA
mgnify:CR=1 FL=1